MKLKHAFLLLAITACGACATVQSIIKSTFPYTATITIPSGSKADEEKSFTTNASSIDEIFGNQNGASFVKDVRVANARVDAVSPSAQNLGVFKAISIYLIADGGKEVMVASRKDIGENIGKTIVLDIDNTRLVDEYLKSNVKLRFSYVLRNDLNSDISLRTAVNFGAQPNNN